MCQDGFFKIIAALCAVLLLASCNSEVPVDSTTLPSQNQTQQDAPVVITPDFKLGYNASDSLHPFEADTAANCAITRLMFDSLFVCDNSFEPRALVAQSYEQSDDVVTVYLKQGIMFSDGSLLTAEDVSYSYSLAKKSSLYSERLSPTVRKKSSTAFIAKPIGIAVTDTENVP